MAARSWGNVAQGSAGGSGDGGEAAGGAIASSYPANGSVPVTISGSTFMGNQAIGGTGDTSGGAAARGAIQLELRERHDHRRPVYR